MILLEVFGDDYGADPACLGEKDEFYDVLVVMAL